MDSDISLTKQQTEDLHYTIDNFTVNCQKQVFQDPEPDLSFGQTGFLLRLRLRCNMNILSDEKKT
jgi:hypothetical protein